MPTGAHRSRALLQGNVLLPARRARLARGARRRAAAARAGRRAGDRGGGASILRRRPRRVCREPAATSRRSCERLKRSTGRKGTALYMPLRFALTGRHDGPELAALLAAMPQSLVRELACVRLRSRGHA